MSGLVERRRVVVTGMGTVSALGCSLAAYRAGLRRCRPGFTGTDDSSEGYVMGPVRCTIPPVDAALGSPFIAFAVQAAREAVEDAHLKLTPELSPRVAVVVGSANGGDGARELAWERRAAGVRPHPQTVLRVMTNAAVGAI